MFSTKPPKSDSLFAGGQQQPRQVAPLTDRSMPEAIFFLQVHDNWKIPTLPTTCFTHDWVDSSAINKCLAEWSQLKGVGISENCLRSNQSAQGCRFSVGSFEIHVNQIVYVSVLRSEHSHQNQQLLQRNIAPWPPCVSFLF